MRLTAIASAIFAAAGTTPTFVWIPDGAISAPEPMWLALWGLALIGFSNTLRSRVRPEEPSGAGALDQVRVGVAQAVSSRA